MSQKILTAEEQLDALMNERNRVYDALGHIIDNARLAGRPAMSIKEMQMLLEERNRLNGQLDYITEPAVRKAYIKRLAWIEHRIQTLKGSHD